MQRKKDAKHKCVMHTLQKLKEVIPLFLLPRPATTYSRILEIQMKNSEQKNSQNGSILQENLISTNPIEPYFLQWPINRVQNVSTGLHKKILTQQTYPRFFPEMFQAFLIRIGGYVPIKGVLIREDRGEFCPRGQRQRQSLKKLVSHS